MKYTIGSDEITVVIDSLGCQPRHITSSSKQEYLWTGDPLVWKDSAPLLFPFVGRFKDKKYLYAGKEYPASLHGFIARRVFTAIKQEKETLVMEYCSTEEDKETYMFPFAITVTYTIVSNTLHITYEVRNRGESEMHFGLGFHPGFTVPLSQTGNVVFEDYYLQFQYPTLKELLMDENCLYSGQETDRKLDKNNRLPLRHSLFDNDALIFKDWGCSVSLQEPTGSHEIRIDTKDFPYLTLWHHPNSADPFICIEPCVSIPGRSGEIVAIAEKEDFKHLAPGGTFSVQMMIACRG